MTVLDCALVVAAPVAREAAGLSQDATDEVRQVVTATRIASLAGLALRSDRAPQLIVVRQNIAADRPMTIWPAAPSTSATISLTAEGCRWSQVAYQFAHELAHVVANNWSFIDGRVETPGAGIEELIAEASAIHALARLAPAWRGAGILGTASYADSIERYRYDYMARHYRSDFNPVEHFGRHAADFAAARAVVAGHHPLAAWLSLEFDTDRGLIEDVAALNRWPRGLKLDLAGYFDAWTRSCAEIGTTGNLPRLLRRIADP